MTLDTTPFRAVLSLLSNVRRLSAATGRAKCPARGISIRTLRVAQDQGLVDVNAFETEVWLTDDGRKALEGADARKAGAQ